MFGFFGMFMLVQFCNLYYLSPVVQLGYCFQHLYNVGAGFILSVFLMIPAESM